MAIDHRTIAVRRLHKGPQGLERFPGVQGFRREGHRFEERGSFPGDLDPGGRIDEEHVPLRSAFSLQDPQRLVRGTLRVRTRELPWVHALEAEVLRLQHELTRHTVDDLRDERRAAEADLVHPSLAMADPRVFASESSRDCGHPGYPA